MPALSPALPHRAPSSTAPPLSEREQRRIGHDLHDGLCQHLTGTALAGQVLGERLAAKSLPEAADAGKVVELVEEGIALARNGLSSAHRDYLARGGLGFFLGDGRLNYRPEQIAEAFFSRRLAAALWASLDYQRIRNPGYNSDRTGPVEVWSVRVHTEF